MAVSVFREDPYHHLRKIEVTVGRPFVRVIFNPYPTPITAGGIPFDYQFGFVWWGIVPPGSSQIVTVDAPAIPEVPPEEDREPNKIVSLSVMSYPDMTPGVLEEVLATATGGEIPPGTWLQESVGSLFDGYNYPYSGSVFQFDAAGGITAHTAYFDDIDVETHFFDPPIYIIG